MINQCSKLAQKKIKIDMAEYGLGDWNSISGEVIPKTQKMVLDATLLNTQLYKIRIKDKVEQSREWRSALPTSQCSSY